MDELQKKIPKISLVGAGPGDPELISVAGWQCLQSADVILYDALVDSAMLDYTPEYCLKICVGKRAGCHSYAQGEINQLMVDMARAYGHVVRLKGGDPYIFGRGEEERCFAESNGIPAQVIPGMSTAFALAELLRISLTGRGISEHYWVLTASTQGHLFSKEIGKAAQLDVPVVILMGMRHLSLIVERYQLEQKGGWEVVIVQQGSLPRQQVLRATLDTVMEKMLLQPMEAPAVIFIGKTLGVNDQ